VIESNDININEATNMIPFPCQACTRKKVLLSFPTQGRHSPIYLSLYRKSHELEVQLETLLREEGSVHTNSSTVVTRRSKAAGEPTYSLKNAQLKSSPQETDSVRCTRTNFLTWRISTVALNALVT